jgi:ankyrin repeat protein
MWASANGHEAVARLLIDNMNDINAEKENGLTALI